MAQRQQLIGLVDEAVANGARQRPACEILGVNERTVQRWREASNHGDQRGQTPRNPHNKLDTAQRMAIRWLIVSGQGSRPKQNLKPSVTWLKSGRTA